jgi:hypothetical protein
MATLDAGAATAHERGMTRPAFALSDKVTDAAVRRVL